jgi:DNA modification methylase
MNLNTIEEGDCLELLKKLPDNSVDSIVTDPPYGIRFMGKKWDYEIPSVEIWKECLRVLKPGGHALIACGTRTQHRMAVNIEDAGFEVRDVITWHYGQGFPKSLSIDKAIDKQLGAEREVIDTVKKAHISQGNTNDGWHRPSHLNDDGSFKKTMDITAPATNEAKKWEGWGTALKPATELWTLVRKPLSESTIAANVLKWGTGGINIDGCRIGDDEIKTNGGNKFKGDGIYGKYETCEESSHIGRFPANLILDEFTAGLLDEQSGILTSGKPAGIKTGNNNNIYGNYSGGIEVTGYGDSGGASRFFYVAKPDADERKDFNTHPTVKPLKLMQYLIKLITPKGGVVLDPFCGSGTTLIAAALIGFDYIGMDLEEANCTISRKRLQSELGMFNKCRIEIPNPEGSDTTGSP